MIRPNLRSLVAAFAVLTGAAPAAVAQYAPHQPLIQLPQSHYQAPIVDHYSEANGPLWQSEQPIEHFVEEVASRSAIRLEFMMFNLGAPPNAVIGAPVSNLGVGATPDRIDGITVPFDVNDNLNGGNPTGLGLFPLTNAMDSGDTPGIRGTWLLDLEEAEMELSFFGFEQAGASLVYPDIDGPRDILAGIDPTIDPALGTTTLPNYVLPLLTDGAVADAAGFNSLIYNDSFEAYSETQMWGSELTFLSRRKLAGGVGFGLQYLGGFRYTNLDENFRFRGSFDGRGAFADYTSFVSATTQNNLYGPELGLRWSLNSKYLTLSATPRVMLGINDYMAHLSSDPLGTGTTVFKSDQVEFATMTQLGLNAEVHLSEGFSVYGGYDFMWLTGVTRPSDNIVYDSTTAVGGGFTPDIHQSVKLNDFMANGFTFGAVFRY
ncbi:MAG: BBP7 family outer membrane beta-barrel protein [Planctomycetota bacterium]